MEEFFSDLLFSAKINGKTGYVYFLFEHKSYMTDDVSLQLLKYMCSIWDAKRKKEKTEKLPIIIPIVIYQGKKTWHTNRCFSELLEGYDRLPKQMQVYIPDFQYILYPISSYQKNDLEACIKLNIMLTLSYDVLTKEGKELLVSVFHALETLEKLDNQQTAIEYLETFLRYVFSVGKNLNEESFVQVKQKIETSYPEGSEVMMTWAEMFMEKGIEKGMQEGLQEGLQKGMQEGLQKGVEQGARQAKSSTLILLLTKRFGAISQEMREKIQQLDLITLDVIVNEIFQLESLDDVQKYLI